MAKRASPVLWDKLKVTAREFRCEPTEAEERLWEQLRGRQVKGIKFRRQHTIEHFIADFYCESCKLAIEIDGEIHQYTKEQDAVRQEYLESLGLRVIRSTNEQVPNNMSLVLQTIAEAIGGQ